MAEKVLHVITGLNIGGAERALYNILAGGLVERFDSAVLALGDTGAFEERLRGLGIPVHALGMRPGMPNPLSLLHLRRVVRKIQPDLIQGWMYHGNLAASAATAVTSGSSPVVWNVRHSLYDLDDEKRSTQWVIRAGRCLSSRPEAVIYNSRLAREQHEAFGFASARGRVIPNGFEVSALGPDADLRARMRQAIGISYGAIVVGHVARFHPMKDHVGFLRASVAVARAVPRVHFLLAGREVYADNPELTGIVPAELMGRFHFLGGRDDVPDLMRVMDVFCTSSAWGEAFPNVIGEAMASEVPCVVTDVGDSAEIVGDTGMVVQPRNEKSLEKALRAMLEKPDEERRAMGKAARSRVVDQYALSAIVDAYSGVYEGLLGGCK
ncbi:Glycosyltransferase involved in cell wall bisynthesis [Thiohalospira halophila DSM 15071]|uniref:Glycosyltransferase involved in cell wall bisynthesis n=1 Tax=Thiohalospira halophila DSM 15071 TaxID=1123397 RepID=A0A1I1NSH6_9GAMM|nr:glycosyltransferase [Thiohalospira halophila]SFC96680.1 Glycosyltransferase involved in cell wall bisynthesis [Thiohalospira halophila DSM 15071]